MAVRQGWLTDSLTALCEVHRTDGGELRPVHSHNLEQVTFWKYR